jgi:hypothetical protein
VAAADVASTSSATLAAIPAPARVLLVVEPRDAAGNFVPTPQSLATNITAHVAPLTLASGADPSTVGRCRLTLSHPR